MKSINHALLRAFHAVATEGSFTRAAKLLNVTQPTLSQQVKQLEETYGVQLFERSGRGVAITDLGRNLFDLSRRLFSAEEEANELLTGVRAVAAGRLAVGADGPFHAVPLISAFAQRYPGPTVSLSVGNSRAVLEGLLETRFDAVVISDMPGDARLYAVPLRRDPVQVLAPKGHPVTRRRSVGLADILGYRLIMREKGSATRRAVEQALQELDLAPPDVMVIESREAVREAVAAGLGIGFISVAEMATDARLNLVPIHGSRIELDEFVVCLRERRRLAIVRAFLDVAASMVKMPAAR
jgi:aminoethylphosphonate catabolism LysR family transcriptional regulator